jgi:hypothetical protein
MSPEPSNFTDADRDAWIEQEGQFLPSLKGNVASEKAGHLLVKKN